MERKGPTKLVIKNNVVPSNPGVNQCCDHNEQVIRGNAQYPKKYDEKLLKDHPDPTIKQIMELSTKLSNKEAIYKEYLNGLGSNGKSKRDAKQQEWLDWALSLPYDKVVKYPVTREDTNLKRHEFLYDMRQKLDSTVHGMAEPKEEIMLEVMKRMMSTENVGKILVLQGAPGVGKTFLCRSVSECVNIPFESIALGSCKDSSLLNGHDYTYVGSHPGMIARALRKMGCSNGILYLDELDKIGMTEKSKEVSSTLLSILDETQNSDFKDNYLTDLSLDLSKLFVIASVNDESLIDPILRNRCKIIKLPDPTVQDKVEIVKNHFIPMYMKQYSIGEDEFEMDDESIKYLMSKVQKEPGVRELKRAVEHILSRFNMLRMTHVEEKSTKKRKVDTSSSKKLVFSYSIPNFKLPMKLSSSIIDTFMSTGIAKEEIDHSVKRMYL